MNKEMLYRIARLSGNDPNNFASQAAIVNFIYAIGADESMSLESLVTLTKATLVKAAAILSVEPDNAEALFLCLFCCGYNATASLLNLLQDNLDYDFVQNVPDCPLLFDIINE